MTPTDSAAPGDFQRSTRMPLDAVVRLHFEGTVAYQNGFAANVSASGMFVKHPDPPELGTRLVFEFSIGSQRRPVQGTGEVVWRREKYEGPGRPAGAGIRFADLDELSRHHLAEALFEFLEASLGDRVTESDEVRGLVDSMPTHAPREFAEELEGRAPAAVLAAPVEVLPPVEPATVPAAEPAPQLSPFRLFDDAAGAPSGDSFGASSPAAAATPAWPPAPYQPPPLPKIAGAASARTERRSSAPLAILAAIVAIAALGFAGWWFWLRPRAPLPAAPSAPAATAPAPAAPTKPPLDARVDGGRTLADTVGKTTAAPDLPLPPAGEPAARPAASSAVPGAAAEAGAAARPEPAASARVVAGLEAQAGETGTTVVIRGDGAFATGAFTWSQIGGDKPRVLVKLEGIEGPYRGTALGVPTAEVQGIRTGYHAKPGGNELHVVVDLVPGVRVEVTAVEPVADRLVLRIDRR